MTKGMNWDKQRFRGKTIEAARPTEQLSRGAWTHVKREPVRKFTAAEKAHWAAANPTLMQTQGRAPASRPRSYEQWCYRTAVEKLVTDIEPNLFVTLAFNCATTPTASKRSLRFFQARLDRETIGPKWQSRQNECCRFIAAVENLETNLHLHVAMNVDPQHLDAVRALAPKIWTEIIPSGDVDVQHVWGAQGLADYIAKQITPEEDERLILSDNVAALRS